MLGQLLCNSVVVSSGYRVATIALGQCLRESLLVCDRKPPLVSLGKLSFLRQNVSVVCVLATKAGGCLCFQVDSARKGERVGGGEGGRCFSFLGLP